jgi:hypothetical protein
VIPVGYMAKRVSKRPDWLKASQVIDVYSVSSCVSEDFADYINLWKHNGYWFFDSPEIIVNIAREDSISLDATSLFYYEAYELQFDGEAWHPWLPDWSFSTKVLPPSRKRLEGFDVVTFSAGTSLECSPLSCNSLASNLRTNEHCLFASFEEARTNVNNGAFRDCEPGPYRILSVSSLDWP